MVNLFLGIANRIRFTLMHKLTCSVERGFVLSTRNTCRFYFCPRSLSLIYGGG